MTRVTNLSAQNLSLALLQQTQNRVMDAQVQISTGKKAERYMGVSQDAGRLVSLEADHARITQFVAGNKVADLRLQKMETAVAGTMEIATSLRTLLVNATHADNASVLTLGAEAESMLAQVAGHLNAEMDGRHLFGGSRTDTPPFDLGALPAGAVAAPAADTYYRGDGERTVLRTGEATTLSYGVTADAPGFDKLVQALQLVKSADTSDPAGARAVLEEALGLANQAVDEIPEIRSGIGSSRRALELANTQHGEFLLFAEGAIGDLENVDPTEAITRLSGHQATLEASYASLARLQSVSLVDYLR